VVELSADDVSTEVALAEAKPASAPVALAPLCETATQFPNPPAVLN
jgi:hypothetical protein